MQLRLAEMLSQSGGHANDRGFAPGCGALFHPGQDDQVAKF
jgi:hypothetical protein